MQNARDRRLNPTEEAYLLRVLDTGLNNERTRRNPWGASIVRIALETAMRQGEIVSLMWQHIDLSAATAFLPVTKNGEARTVPLSSKAVAILKGLPRSIDGRVFPITQNALQMAWERALKRAKKAYEMDCKKMSIESSDDFFSNLRFHDLRHEAISRIAEKLTNILELASVTGHKDLQMLKRYYHPRAQDLAKKLG